MKVGDVVELIPPFYRDAFRGSIAVVEAGPYEPLDTYLVGFPLTAKKLWVTDADVIVREVAHE